MNPPDDLLPENRASLGINENLDSARYGVIALHDEACGLEVAGRGLLRP